jgi:hypothetical protein
MDIENKDDDVCLGKLSVLTSTRCSLDLIFSGARSVKTVYIDIEYAAHVKEFTLFDEGLGHNVTHQEQVGEGGLKPFLDQIRNKYPNIQLMPHDVFDEMVAAQKKAAEGIIK